MHTKSISGTVTTTVVLGEGNYGDKLTITSTGAVFPSAYGAAAVYASVTVVRLTNDGRVIGAKGEYGAGVTGGIGGVGVDFTRGGEIQNKGTISGGMGGNAEYPGAGGAGAVGVNIAIGGVTNEGLIVGGYGGKILSGNGGAAGAGVDFGTGVVTNTGVIRGRYGGRSAGFYGGSGGIALQFTSVGTLTNQGSVIAGNGAYGEMGGGNGGIAVQMDARGTVTNSGTITGGSANGSGHSYPSLPGAGGAAVDLLAGGSIQNTGFIRGGAGGGGYGHLIGPSGGAGIQIIEGSVTNSGTVVGGNGGFSYYHQFGGPTGGAGVILNESNLDNGGIIIGGGNGGIGVYLVNGGTITNQGTITGGYGVLAGEGVDLKQATALLNDGTIAGANGLYSSAYNAGQYNGGVAAYIDATSVINNGQIIGGTGGNSVYGDGGSGGIAVTLAPGASLTNTGAIIGGAGGGSGFDVGGDGSVGVVLSGNTLIDSGTIDGGGGGEGRKANGTDGAAIQFGSVAATLEISPPATFDGAIEANSAVRDTLVLESKGSGTLSGFGTTITGFTTIAEDASARWTLSGSITGAGSIEIGGGATLTLDGTVSISTLSFASAGNETLRLENPADFTSTLSGFGAGDTVFLSGIEATSLKYSGHVLTLFDAGGTAVDTLTFNGKYTPADFGLDAVHGGTDLNFVDGAVAPRDVLPTLFIPPSGGVLTEIGGSHVALIADNAVLLHFGHVSLLG